MVNRQIRNDLKECALRLWNHGWDLEDICEALGVSRSSCYRWRKVFEEFGAVNRPPSPLVGRTRIITRAVLGPIEELYLQDFDLFLDEIRIWLAVEHRIEISMSTLSRNLIDTGLTRKMLQKLASERDEVRREEFKYMLQTDFVGDGSEFVIVDETSKNERSYARRFGRTFQGQHAQSRDLFPPGTQYSLCAALTTDGYLTAHVIEGSYDAEEFYNFIVQDVLPHMNPYPQERSVLVLDNCWIHHKEDLANLVERAGCLILFLPPHSPDLTPIEESFNTLKAYIRRHSHELRPYEDPVHALLEATACITSEKAQEWFKNAGYITE